MSEFIWRLWHPVFRKAEIHPPLDSAKLLGISDWFSNHGQRQVRGGRLLFAPQLLQVIANVLLVVAGLGSAWRVTIFGPKTRGVGCEDFIDERYLISDQAELNLVSARMMPHWAADFAAIR